MTAPGPLARLLGSLRAHTATWFGGGLALALLVRAHQLYMAPVRWLNVDESYAGAIGLRILDPGGLPYVAGVSQRGPVMYWLYALALSIGGAFRVASIRYGALLFALATVVLVLAALLVLSAARGAALAALLVVWTMTAELPPADGLAWNGELIALPFVLGQVVLCAHALSGRARRPLLGLALAGALMALAVLSKQSFAGHGVVSLLWLALVLRPRRRLLLGVASFGGGALLVVCAVLGPYVATGHLGEFWYYFVRWGREVYMAPVSLADITGVVERRILLRLPYVALLVLGGVGAVLAARRAARRGDRAEAAALWAALANAVVAIPGATFTGRDFGHYLLQTDVFVALLVGLVAGSLLRERRLPRPRLVLAVALAACVLAGVAIVVKQDAQLAALRRAPWFDVTVPARDPVSAWVRRNTAPSDRIFVWGFRADIHFNARRWPASRYVYALYPSGVSPWYLEPPATLQRRVAPHSHQILIDELEHTPARWVLDAGDSLLGRFMVDYPVLAAYLREKYCFERMLEYTPVYGSLGPVSRLAVYRRRAGPEQPCTPIPLP